MSRVQLFDFEATWWRAKINREGDVLTPSEPYEPYNPFKAYIAYGRSPSRESRSILYEFLKVAANDVAAVVNFCERFGVLGHRVRDDDFDDLVLGELERPRKQIADLESPLELKSLSELTSLADGERWSLGKHVSEKLGPEAQDPMPASKPMDVYDFRRAQKLANKAAEFAQLAQSEKNPIEARKAREWLCYLSNRMLRMVCPRLNWNKEGERWVTGWDLGSLEGAFYLMLLFDVQSQGKILTCPRCHLIFLAEHPRTVFCSLRCQNANKAQVFRDRHSMPAKKGNRPKPSSKRRT